MLPIENFSQLLRYFHSSDRLPVRANGGSAQGQLILDGFLQHTPFSTCAVYLRESRDSELRLVAKAIGVEAPETLVGDIPSELLDRSIHGEKFVALNIAREMSPEPQILLPLVHMRDPFGVIALAAREDTALGGSAIDALDSLSVYLSAVLANQRLTNEAREGDFQLRYRLWELESLYDIGLSIAATLNLEELSEVILTQTISLLNARRAAFYLKNSGRFELMKSLGEVRSQFLDDELCTEDERCLMNEGKPLMFEETANCIFPNCTSFIALPIRATDGTVTGVLAAADRETRSGVGPFDDNDMRLLSQFANQASIALENARLHREALQKQALEHDLELAATIQKNILPRALPSMEGYEIATFSRPARQLGGDYYSFFENEAKLAFCVADVAGKSVPAAILVSALHAALQLLVDERRELGDIATELNRHIHRWSSETKFITMIMASIDRQKGEIEYVNCGHNPGYLMAPDGLHALPSHGLPIGLMSGTSYKTQRRAIVPASTVVFYSDGITEAADVRDEEFGYVRLQKIIEDHAAAPVSQLKDAIAREVDEFVGDEPQGDDQTIVVVRTT